MFGPRDLHHLDFIELVLPDQSAHVGAIRTSFTTEAGRVGRVLQRQRLAVQNLAAMQVGERHFSGRNQIQIPVAAILKRSASSFGSCPVPSSEALLTRNGGSTSRYPCSRVCRS